MRPAPSAAIPTLAALLALLLTLAPAGPAAAQEADAGLREHRAGFWLSGGFGVGTDEDEAGGAGYLRLGGTPSPQIALGFDGVSYTRDADVGDATITRSNATAAIYFFPEVEKGLFLKAGLGFAHTEVEQTEGDVTITVEDDGLGATLGAGWDLQLGGGNLYLTPNVDVALQDLADGADPLYLFTVGIGFR